MAILKKLRVSMVFAIVMMLVLDISAGHMVSAKSTSLAFVVLSDYHRTLDIGDSFYLTAVASNGEIPVFRSSSSSIASVDAYGMVTAKKAGTVTITAKVKNGEASCRVKVNKTTITLSKKQVTLEHGETYRLVARTSTRATATFKSSKSSVVTVEDRGRLHALKPGEALITVRADGSSETCKVIVKQPDVTLSQSRVSMYKGQELQLTAEVSSGIAPVWKSNRSSVAVVDETGKVTAIKNGTAIITAKVDGIARICEVTVEKPTITLSPAYLKIKCGKTAKIKADVSSGNIPVWTSGNSSIVSIDSNGKIKANKKGTTYVTASEDGTKERCKIVVVE